MYININQMKKTLLLLILLCGSFCACTTTQNVVYFQDRQIGQEQIVENNRYITVQPQDQVSIVVSSKDPQLATLFNLPRVQQSVGSSSASSSQGGQTMGYTVDTKGDVDFPILGKIHIAGLTREEVAAKIKSELISQNQVKDPVVTVEFTNLSFSVMGEVAKPGKYGISRDQMTILEALSMAGDLTIYGKRDKVFLTRTTADKRITYELDMRSSDVYSSPAFFVQQNDMIYVEPNKVRVNQSTVNGNSVRSVPLWISIASFLTTIGVLIFK